MNQKDYEAGLTDYKNLSDLIKDIRARAPKINISIWQSDTLHAKCYVTERGAIIGSCNLTRAGFESNVELAIRLEAYEAMSQLSVRDSMRLNLHHVSKQQWEGFLDSLEKLPAIGLKVPPDTDGSWESFVQGILSEGPPHLKTQMR
jgi:phosphatidylserine/phosphatidylglycerophosphate/cardiolipin synthase-like enzyme